MWRARAFLQLEVKKRQIDRHLFSLFLPTVFYSLSLPTSFFSVSFSSIFLHDKVELNPRKKKRKKEKNFGFLFLKILFFFSLHGKYTEASEQAQRASCQATAGDLFVLFVKEKDQPLLCFCSKQSCNYGSYGDFYVTLIKE